PQIPHGIFFLDPDESRHVVKVLRKKQGEKIRITDGQGIFYDATITKPDPHQCLFEVIAQMEDPPNAFAIHVAISPTKNTDRIEWFVEKAVEFGIDEITLMACDHTERQHFKIDRFEKIAISAMKQSLKSRLPVINPLTNFRQVILSGSVEKFIAHVDNENPMHLKNVVNPRSKYLVLIGPEGDFSDEELLLAQSHGFKKVSLGTSRLRTETAGLAACHILNLANTP
ncbi:MAG TPA: 16S rRNA (uracil(1498)-N(3))-methyltransferase, partial [Chryseolinea sp.]|nr:16S rRNA (uracil(1498)-N(3))-methyltransferase [Chryseolinea sp.]